MFYNSKPITGMLSALAMIAMLIQPAIRGFAQTEDLLFDVTAFGAVEPAATAQPKIEKAILEDWSDMVTKLDMGINDFFGNSGAINKNGKPYIVCKVLHSATESQGLRCDWKFTISNDKEAYTGWFFCLFGLCETKARFADSPYERDAVWLKFPEHSLNLDRIDGIVTEPSGPRRFEKLNISVDYTGSSPLWLRVELKDTKDKVRYTRFKLQKSDQPTKRITWDFRKSYKKMPGGDLDLSRVKTLSLVVERENVADKIKNPATGRFDLKQVWFTPNRVAVKPANTTDYLNLVERRTFQYFIDWSSRKTASYGIPQDRSSFGDLLTVGGVGFALPAYIIGVERGWIKREEARSRTVKALRTLSKTSAFGSASTGKIGYKGWFYHFLGVDGCRKLNFDFVGTPDRDESKNTVELSTIDTGLALLGVLAAQSYFTGGHTEEQEIRRLAQQIYNNVDWPFMLEPQLLQFYLGWKPKETRDENPSQGFFAIPDGDGKGDYSGTLADPATLDYYTDEALLLILLAAGSETHPLPLPKTTYCELVTRPDPQGLIRSYPGALFTYQFFQAFLDSRPVNGKPPHFPRCLDEQQAVDWFANSKRAIQSTIDYATSSPPFKTYSSSAWGLSAAEGPQNLYGAYGAPTAALNPRPDQDGTVTYYGMGSALGFARKSGDIRDKTLNDYIMKGLDAAWSRGHWHYRFGLPDAFNADITPAVALAAERQASVTWLRKQGKWVQRALFAIDQGPMLLHLENARSGRIWKLLAANPNITRAVARLQAQLPEQFRLEGENGQGNGSINWRSNASALKTVWLHAGEMRNWQFPFDGQGQYVVSLHYSNDGPADTVAVFLDNTQVGQCVTQSTGGYGYGWNQFAECFIGNVTLSPGSHTLTVKAVSTDFYGVEIDYVGFKPDAVIVAP